MSYDISELLKNYLHGWQITQSALLRQTAEGIITWVNDVLSDQHLGGFYASQDADYSLDDDGDYFTWTLEEARTALSAEELKVASLYYDISEVGEMHHNPAKNVLYVRAPIEQIAVRLNMQSDRVTALLDSAKQKMYDVRRKRPTPYVDRTVYVNWNALCISAYLEAARVLQLSEAQHFALRSLDRILAQAWKPSGELLHVVAY